VKRFGALVLAVAMVAAAFYARGALGTDDEDDVAGGGGEQPAGIVCASDLAELCAAAGVPMVGKPAAGDTADALIAADDAADLGGRAWLTTSAWAALVDAERSFNRRDPLFEVAGAPIASSGVVVAVWADRASQLSTQCEQPADASPGWACLADQAGTTPDDGNRVRVAGPEVDSAFGLVVAVSQAAGLLGRTDFPSNDFDDAAFQGPASRLAGGQMSDALATMRLRGPGEVTAAGTVAARATKLDNSFGVITLAAPEPTVRADVVLVVPTGTDVPEQQRAALAEALTAAGWDPPSAEPDGLPSGGVLAAIRTLWSQNR